MAIREKAPRNWRLPKCAANLMAMDHPKRLADPDFEPTDEDLIGISKRAFAHVPEARAESLRKLREAIAVAGDAALERLRARRLNLKAPR